MEIIDVYKKNINQQIEIENAFGARKSGSTTDYNFDIEEMIDNFSFYDLVYQVDDVKKEADAFFVVTDNQYIIGFNSDYGLGSHQQSFAKCMAELEGGKKLNGYKDMLYYSNKCQEKFITARIVFYQSGYNDNYQPRYSGNMIFMLENKQISQPQAEVFNEFYDAYNLQVKALCRKHQFKIAYSYEDEDGNHKSRYSDDLTELKNYIETNALPLTTNYCEEEKIIGKEISSLNCSRRK